MDILSIPKVELHCHLDGSLPLDVVRELSGDATIAMAQLQAADDCNSLTEYLEKFELPIKCLQTAPSLKRAGYELLKDVNRENVRYIEVRFAPALHQNQGLSLSEVLESLLAGLEAGKQAYGIDYNVITCAMRHLPIEQNLEMLHTAREFLGRGVCALDLAGDESAFPTSNFRELFHKAAEIGMPYTIHSGECQSVENVREAFALGAKRIGHGIALRNDPALIHQFAKHQIGIEMCPVSNLQTKAVDSFANYPLFDFLEQGLKVSVNTDNRTVSNTSMSRELEMIYKSCGGDDQIIYQLLQNAVDTSFAEDSIKQQLTKEIQASKNTSDKA